MRVKSCTKFILCEGTVSHGSPFEGLRLPSILDFKVFKDILVVTEWIKKYIAYIHVYIHIYTWHTWHVHARYGYVRIAWIRLCKGYGYDTGYGFSYAIPDMSNEHSRYVTVRAHQHRHGPAPNPLANAQETIDFSLTLLRDLGASWRWYSHGSIVLYTMYKNGGHYYVTWVFTLLPFTFTHPNRPTLTKFKTTQHKNAQ